MAISGTRVIAGRWLPAVKFNVRCSFLRYQPTSKVIKGKFIMCLPPVLHYHRHWIQCQLFMTPDYNHGWSLRFQTARAMIQYGKCNRREEPNVMASSMASLCSWIRHDSSGAFSRLSTEYWNSTNGRELGHESGIIPSLGSLTGMTSWQRGIPPRVTSSSLSRPVTGRNSPLFFRSSTSDVTFRIT